MDALTALINIESLLINSAKPNIQTAKRLIKLLEPELSDTEKPLFNILESHLDALSINSNRTIITLALAVISQSQLLLITSRH